MDAQFIQYIQFQSQPYSNIRGKKRCAITDLRQDNHWKSILFDDFITSRIQVFTQILKNMYANQLKDVWTASELLHGLSLSETDWLACCG